MVGNIQGKIIKIGNADFISASVLKNAPKEFLVTIDVVKEESQTVVLVSEDDKVIGLIGIADAIKSSAKSAAFQPSTAAPGPQNRCA